MQLFNGKKHRVNGDSRLKTIKLSVILIMVLFFFITIGYSAFNTVLDIESLAAYVGIDKDIRITQFVLHETNDGGISNWNQHTKTTVSTSIDLPNADSSVIYEIEVTNLGNIEMGVLSITGLPEGLEYELDGYTLKEELCDEYDSSKCKLGSKTRFLITFSKGDDYYPQLGNNFNVDLAFAFKRFYNISYVNINTANLPTRVLENDNITINLNQPYPESVDVTGNTNNSYTANTGELQINNVENDIVVTYMVRSYFIEYNGVNGLFNTFDKTNIKKFERNTTLSLQDVQTKVSNGTATIVSTASDDPNYPSYYEVYAWVENNEMYWWSQSNVVYYHPNTRNAFRDMTKLLNVNLYGTDTSLVQNFSHWFDKDSALVHLYGTINTSGLVQQTTNYNFGNDSTDNNSSETGLAFMFNDCKALLNIDTSEFDTSNAIDMKRMFGGCKAVTNLDVSNFDTSNVKSMYWMFRNTTSLTSLDIRNFDTSNVQNMTGMFLSSTALKTLYLGEDFNTSNVKRFNNMFNNAKNLETVYAYDDFQLDSMTASSSMFTSATKIVGSKGTLDETTFDSSKVNHQYAKLAMNGQKGYFTPYETKVGYHITYFLEGGTANNPTVYYEDGESFTLNEPVRGGYAFIGWTGSNGNNIQRTVTIESGTTGDLYFVAHYENFDTFPTVFAVEGPCHFGGSNEGISGENCVSTLDGTDYTSGTYIDTGVSLYDLEHYTQDFEVYFEISDYDPAQQETMPDGNKQNTIFNSKIEIDVLNPGMVFRKNGDNLELKSGSTSVNFPALSVNAVKIIRKNRKIYYSINGSDLYLLDDTSNSDSAFDLTVWFGASQTADGQPFRYANCTLSNIYMKLGTSY